MAFVGVELYQISDARLLTGHVGRKLTRDLAPERVHQGVRIGVERRLYPKARFTGQGLLPALLGRPVPAFHASRFEAHR